jgi:hypothetical protein
LPAATEFTDASENGPRGYDLAWDLHETKVGRMGNLTAMKMEAETVRRGLAGENGEQRSSYTWRRRNVSDRGEKNTEEGTGTTSTVRRSSATARFRW